MTFGLFDAQCVDIPPHQHGDQTNSPKRRLSNHHTQLRVSVHMLDRAACFRADRIRKLRHNIGIYDVEIGQFLDGQVREEFLGQCILPCGGGEQADEDRLPFMLAASQADDVSDTY
jgi:hypothetical protein